MEDMGRERDRDHRVLSDFKFDFRKCGCLISLWMPPNKRSVNQP